nr:ribonuclease H-like domain, reverse transcriptase, RNA-dependent DNA polymerase [Tanacetum cinerariifolium]
EVYVTQPEGFVQQRNSRKVYKLIKALYGLRQAPRWNVKLDQTLKSLDFKRCNLEQAVYTRRSKTSTLIVGVYVDDLIITAPRKEIDVFKSQMKEKFEMSDLGLLAYYLGIEVTQTGGEITIKQTGYINKILKETSMTDINDTKIPMDPGTKLVKAEDGNTVDATYYRSLIGSLKYLLHTRPDLSYSVGLLSRFMQDPKDHHLKAVKQVIRYIKGTKEHGIIYKKEGGCKITSYSDSSYGINTDQGKGTTGILFYFGESPITRCTQKQPTMALSSCESKFLAATGAACQALWLKRLLSELDGWKEERITLKVDNISAIALVRNPVFHGRSKHIDIRYHFIQECVENGHINVEHVSEELQRADILTKALPRLKETEVNDDTFPHPPSEGKLRGLPPLYKFPPHLNKLTLSDTLLDWKHMSTIGMLPYLEVLKLKVYAFKGPKWEPLDDGFRLLKVFQLGKTDLKEWMASAHHFPRLEHIVLEQCTDLLAIPHGLVDVSALQTMKLYHTPICYKVCSVN